MDINNRRFIHLDLNDGGSGGEGAFVGFNATRISELGPAIQSAAEDACADIVDELYNGVVTPMSKAWYSPEGKKFFEGFRDSVAAVAVDIQAAFDDYRGNIQTCANYWSDNTGAASIQVAEVKNLTISLTISDILDQKENGDVGIVADEARAVASNLTTIQDNIKTKLSAVASRLDASTAFVGGNQAEALQGLFTRVNNCVANIFKGLTEGEEDKNLYLQINKVVHKYESISTSISSNANSVSKSSNSDVVNQSELS